MPTFRRADFIPFALSVTPSNLNRRHTTNVHIAMVFVQGKTTPIASAMNKVGTRSNGAGFSDYTIHAERAVLKKVGDITKLRGATLVVLRISGTGELRNSQPCSECKCHLDKCIKSYGLRRVYYS